MRVLLAGASGAIGRELVPRLLGAGHEVVGITRRRGSIASAGVTEVVADVNDRAGLLTALDGVKAQAVIHQLTALHRAPRGYRDMRETNRLRSEGTSTLIAAARAVGAKRFVAASVFYGYGFRDHGDAMLDETAPFGLPDGTRNDLVQEALLTNELQVRAFGGIALRYGMFYEPGAKRVAPVARGWNGVLPLVHISDAAAAAVLALTKGKAGHAYNIADGSPASFRELQAARASAAGIAPPVELPAPLIRAAAPFGAQLVCRTSIRMSMAKARRELGWRPQYASIAEGLPPLPPDSLVE
jgi:nucleoside-diphosphate-sugar epimerase